MKPLVPVLKPIEIINNVDIINGMMPIEIENYDEIFDDESYYRFTLRYKFNVPNDIDTKSYANNRWQFKVFNIYSNLCVMDYSIFIVKVPLFLSSYSLEYNLNITKLKINFNDYKECERIGGISSCNYTANVPSILLEPTFSKNDDIQYRLADTSYAVAGTVLEILENDMIKIKTDPRYDDDKLQDIITVHKSEVYTHPVPKEFIVDITDKNQAETDLILRTPDTESINVYKLLTNGLSKYFLDEIFSEEIAEEGKNFEYMSTCIAANIHQCLYSSHYNYRIKCMFDDSYLLLQQQWQYYLWRYYIYDHKERRCVIRDVQEAINEDRYSCTICRSKINWYQYVYHCQCEEGYGPHHFCIICIHSLITQYYEMKSFVVEALNGRLDNHCIEEIVTFCVGKVIKFDVKNNDIHNKEDIDMMDFDEIEIDQEDVIDDTKSVTSKRRLL